MSKDSLERVQVLGVELINDDDCMKKIAWKQQSEAKQKINKYT